GVLNAAIDSIRAHLDRGAPWDACDAFREASTAHPDDARLLYWGALAHARAGATQTAHALLDHAERRATQTDLVADIRSLRGRLFKDAYYRAAERDDARAMLDRACDQYRQAYARTNDAYPGINAASLSMLLGARDEATRMAREVLARLASRGEGSAWDLATRGEAELLLGEHDAASRSYAAAYRAASGNAGMIASMRRQLVLLERALPAAGAMHSQLPAVDVVAFAGHMVDAPGRAQPRFPDAIVAAVAAAIDAEVAALRDPIVFTSAACGADLLFIEAAQARGAEVNVVLPFDRDDFVRASVAVGGEAWIGRFDAALARASRVIMATTEAYLGDEVLFEHAARLVEGLAMLRAQQLETTPTLLCLLDAGETRRVGGTQASVERWQRTVGSQRVIDLGALRRHAAGEPPRARDGDAIAARRSERHAQAVAAGRGDAPSSAVHCEARGARTLRTMLFADFAGYSKLHDAVAPLFQERFLDIGARLIASFAAPPQEAKTWGDALYAVFVEPQDGAEFALQFLARMQGVDWAAAGLPDTGRVRIALHAGPVFCGFDPIVQRPSHFGASVTRAARIEPVTPPGMIYASEAFAATLASTGTRDYALEYVGSLQLAKGYGESRLYRLERR
ncbi:MAG: TRAFs-binding domain-containing protein, partial [Rudaea sp.]